MAVLQPHLVSVNGTSSSRKRYIGHHLQLQCAEITSSMHKQYGLVISYPSLTDILLQQQPARIIDVDFSQPKSRSDSPDETNSVEHPSAFSPATPNEQFAFLSGLRQLYPSAAILSSTFIQLNPAAQPPKIRVPRKLPPTVGTLYHPKYQKFS